MHTNNTRATGTEYIHIYFVSKYYGGLSGAVIANTVTRLIKSGFKKGTVLGSIHRDQVESSYSQCRVIYAQLCTPENCQKPSRETDLECP